MLWSSFCYRWLDHLVQLFRERRGSGRGRRWAPPAQRLNGFFSQATRNKPSRAFRSRSGYRPCLEWLEDRTLLSLTAVVGPNVNISQVAANQHESTIVVNPTNTQNLFAASNNDAGGGNFVSVSTNGGTTWAGRQLGTGAGPGGDGLPAGGGDVQAAFDPFGNLYLTYISGNSIVVVLSTDGGQTFSTLNTFNTTGAGAAVMDQPSIATGANSVWVSYRDNNGNIIAAGANVTGLGAANIGAFASQTVPGSANGPALHRHGRQQRLGFLPR